MSSGRGIERHRGVLRTERPADNPGKIALALFGRHGSTDRIKMSEHLRVTLRAKAGGFLKGVLDGGSHTVRAGE
jgi:hypothetical protein